MYAKFPRNPVDTLVTEDTLWDMRATEDTKRSIKGPLTVKLPEEMRGDLGSAKAETRRSYASLLLEAWQRFRSSGFPRGASKAHTSNMKTRGGGTRKSARTEAHPSPSE